MDVEIVFQLKKKKKKNTVGVACQRREQNIYLFEKFV